MEPDVRSLQSKMVKTQDCKCQKMVESALSKGPLGGLELTGPWSVLLADFMAANQLSVPLPWGQKQPPPRQDLTAAPVVDKWAQPLNPKPTPSRSTCCPQSGSLGGLTCPARMRESDYNAGTLPNMQTKSISLHDPQVPHGDKKEKPWSPNCQKLMQNHSKNVHNLT